MQTLSATPIHRSPIRRVAPFPTQLEPPAIGVVAPDWVRPGDLLFTCRPCIWQRLCHGVGDFFHHVGIATRIDGELKMVDFSIGGGGARTLEEVEESNVLAVARPGICSKCVLRLEGTIQVLLGSSADFAWIRAVMLGTLRALSYRGVDSGSSLISNLITCLGVVERSPLRSHMLCTDFALQAMSTACCAVSCHPLGPASQLESPELRQRLVMPHDLWRSPTLQDRRLVVS